MIFTGPQYFLFFLIPCAILFRLARPGVREWVLVFFGASFFVYYAPGGSGGWLASACLLIFIWEALFSRLYRDRSGWCIAGIVIAIAVLGVFKYWNFVTGALTYPLGHNPARWSGAFLPLGISFFTFEFIHYAADRYKGTATKGRIAEYLAFILFFPTMVAGPIKRYQQFIPKLKAPTDDWRLDWHRGGTRIVVGLSKKFALADLLTAFTAHLNPTDIAQASRWTLILWIVAYGWKIYFDFSAYSDIAIGSARLMGIAVPENFDWPYFRINIVEFWRHWHISLYRWLVDYIFIPLGGSRGSLAFACANIFAVMLISGLWHGAGLHFILWGAWHGLLICIHRVWRFLRGPRESRGRLVWPARACSWALTYVSVTLGWALFAMDTRTAFLFMSRLL